MHVKEILSRNPPDLLYHYTTQTGLLGIVEKKEIWASHTQYLNDQREFHHAIAIVKEELHNMRRMTKNADSEERLAEMEQEITLGIESINVCVCSFSGVGDLLSQWRAYGGGSGGFSIGFSGSFLRSICEEQRFWIVPCLYDEAEQQALVRALLEDVLDENVARTPGEEAEYLPRGGNLLAYLNRYAPILKHSSFSEEREWRIISRPLMCSNELFDYRAGASMLIPYYRIPLSAEKTKFQIQEVIVGPSPHPVQSEHSVRGLLIRHDLDRTKVYQSAAPYRNW